MRGFTCHRRRRGYFLLEVVLALLIASFVLRGVFALANGSLALSRTMTEEGASLIAQEAFLGFLERNFEQLPGNAMMELRRDDAGSHWTSDLTFQNVTVSFSWAGQAISAEAIQLSAVLRRDGDLDIVLRYYEEPILNESDPTVDVSAEPVAEITLLRDVWRFEWWALDGRTLEWTEEWDVRGRMPLQLELNVLFSRNGEQVVHYFWIPPKVNPATVMRSFQRKAGAGGGNNQQQGDGNDDGQDAGAPRAGRVEIKRPGGGR